MCNLLNREGLCAFGFKEFENDQFAIISFTGHGFSQQVQTKSIKEMNQSQLRHVIKKQFARLQHVQKLGRHGHHLDVWLCMCCDDSLYQAAFIRLV